MNSKTLQEKVQEIEDEQLEEMRLRKRSNHELETDDKVKDSLTLTSLPNSQSVVSLKHYDQVRF